MEEAREEWTPAWAASQIEKYRKAPIEAAPVARVVREHPVLVEARRVEEFDISGRLINCFTHANIVTVRDLMERSEKDLMCIKNFGKVCLAELRAVITDPLGLRIKGERLVSPAASITPRDRQYRPVAITPGAPLARLARRMRPGVVGVYVIRCETTGRFKIGKSINLASRLGDHSRNLPSTTFPGPLRVARIIPCSAKEVGIVELLLHRLYLEQRIGVAEVFEAKLAPCPTTFRSVKDVLRACMDGLVAMEG